MTEVQAHPRENTHVAPPHLAVHLAFFFWLSAVALGVIETVIELGRAVVDEADLAGMMPLLAIRVIVFSLAIYVTFQMRHGKNWARVTLAIGLGIFGMLSMIMHPIQRLVEGVSMSRILDQSEMIDFLFGTSRTLHIAAVAVAVVLMFVPSANAYFRAKKEQRKKSRNDHHVNQQDFRFQE